MPDIVLSNDMEPTAPASLPIADQSAWRLVNHGIAWTMLGVLILALAGLFALMGEAMGLIASSSNSKIWGGSSGAQQLLIIKVFYIVSCVGGVVGLMALTTGLAWSGALSPVRTARWLALLTLGASYAAIYCIASAIFWYEAKENSSRGMTNEAAVYAATSIILSVMTCLLALLLGQALLACLAHAWNDQKTIARIKWYLKCQFALPALLLVAGIGCGLLLAPNVAMILIVTGVLATYIFLAILLLKNIYLLHRSILWQLEPELAKVAPPPPPKPVIDPLAD
jgi:hypothetical protein